jgi:hypothetical protein
VTTVAPGPVKPWIGSHTHWLGYDIRFRIQPRSSPLSRTRKDRACPAELAGIFERLGLSAQRWQHGMEKLRGDRLVGRFFAASRAKLREIADRIGVRHLVNLTGCPIR